MILKYLLIAVAIGVLWFMIRTRGRITVVDDVVKAVKRITGVDAPPPVAPAPRVENLVRCAKCGAYGPIGKPCICASS